MTSAARAPSPKTVWVPTCQRWQPLQPAAASRRAVSDSRSGRKSAADPVAAARAMVFVWLLQPRSNPVPETEPLDRGIRRLFDSAVLWVVRHKGAHDAVCPFDSARSMSD